MGIAVYDYRNPEHVKNLFVTSEMRSRILRLEPGLEFNERHSHDLGHEVFLILQGIAEFEINGEIARIEPGQLCFAAVDEPHAVRVVGDEPVIMYLSVTPHILPTHTMLTADGEPKPIQFAGPDAYDVTMDAEVSRTDRIERQRRAVSELARRASALAQNHAEILDELESTDADAEEIRIKLWEDVRQVYKGVAGLGESWNDLASDLGSDR